MRTTPTPRFLLTLSLSIFLSLLALTGVTPSAWAISNTYTLSGDATGIIDIDLAAAADPFSNWDITIELLVLGFPIPFNFLGPGPDGTATATIPPDAQFAGEFIDSSTPSGLFDVPPLVKPPSFTSILLATLNFVPSL